MKTYSVTGPATSNDLKNPITIRCLIKSNYDARMIKPDRRKPIPIATGNSFQETK